MSPTAWVLLGAATVVALAVASFTNVVIDRLPLALDEPNEFGELWDTRPWPEVLAGRSRCSTCGTQLRWFDNIPVVSYLVLRGRCRSCGTPYGAYHLAVELGVPAAAALVTWGIVHHQGWTWVLLPAVVLVPVGAAVAVIDVRTLMVPTRIVWPAAVLTAVLCVVAALAEGSPGWLVGTAFGVVALAGPLFVVWWFVPTGMGFGDVRLCVLLGMVVGLAAASTGRSWPWSVLLAVICLALSSLVGLVMALPFLVVGQRKVPFGPSLVVGALVCVTLAAPILEPFG